MFGFLWELTSGNVVAFHALYGSTVDTCSYVSPGALRTFPQRFPRQGGPRILRSILGLRVAQGVQKCGTCAFLRPVGAIGAPRHIRFCRYPEVCFRGWLHRRLLQHSPSTWTYCSLRAVHELPAALQEALRSSGLLKAFLLKAYPKGVAGSLGSLRRVCGQGPQGAKKQVLSHPCVES